MVGSVETPEDTISVTVTTPAEIPSAVRCVVKPVVKVAIPVTNRFCVVTEVLSMPVPPPPPPDSNSMNSNLPENASMEWTVRAVPTASMKVTKPTFATVTVEVPTVASVMLATSEVMLSASIEVAVVGPVTLRSVTEMLSKVASPAVISARVEKPVTVRSRMTATSASMPSISIVVTSKEPIVAAVPTRSVMVASPVTD